MSISELKRDRALRAQQFSGAPAPSPVQGEVPTSVAGSIIAPFQEREFITTDPKKKATQSFSRKVGEDALLLGLAPAAAVATGVDLIRDPVDTTKLIAGGVVQGYKDMFDGQEWKDHPLLNTVNTVANISVVGSILKSAVLSGTKASLLRSAKDAAKIAGVDAILVNNIFKSKRFLSNAFKEGEKLNSSEPVIGAIAKEYEKAGMTKEVARFTAQDVSEKVFTRFLDENRTKLDTLNAIAHPVAALGTAGKFVSRPIAKAIFGRPEQSAVGKLYGSKVVKQDVPGFAVVEEWASMQVAERGIKDTVTNRVRQIQDWIDNSPEYAALTPLQRNKHFAEYAKTDLLRQKFAESKGREYVLTKALPKNYIEALQDFVKKQPKIDKDGTKITNAKIIELLEKQYGKDFTVHSQEVSNRMKGQLESTERRKLLDSVRVLGDSRVPVSLRRLTKDETKFVKDLEGSGYRIGRAPTKTIISQAADVTGKKFSKENLVTHRSTIGKLVDRFGISPENIVEGSQFFAFRENLTQGLIKKYGFAKNIEVRGAKVPIRSLHNTLETLRKIQEKNKTGILPSNYTIADLRFSDLIKMGFSKKDAKIIDKILRESNVTPASLTGAGEALSNYLKTRNNPLSRTYNSFLRVQSDLRFKKNPMFAMQAAVETIAWGSLFTKTVPTPQFLIKSLSRVKGLETPLKNAIREPSMPHQQLVQENVLVNYNRQLRDASAPEIYRGLTEAKDFKKTGVEGFAEKAGFAARNADSNIWLGAFGFSNVKIATNLMTSYAKKFGMTLDDALEFTFRDADGKILKPDETGGTKVYTNPQMVSRMQDAAQGIFGYQGAGLNSPLIRTLNTMFFPLRFSTKSMVQTSRWLSDLSPASRLAVINSWVASAQWITTDEGQRWKNKERGVAASMFNYTFAYEGLGKTINSVTKGELFGGNTGLIGGLQFGAFINLARDMGYISEEEQINTTTGRPYRRKVIKDPTSFPAFVKAVEAIILSMSPAMPFYTATGGEVRVFLNRGVRNFIEDVMSVAAGSVDPYKDSDDYKRAIERGERTVPVGFRRPIIPE